MKITFLTRTSRSKIKVSEKYIVSYQQYMHESYTDFSIIQFPSIKEMRREFASFRNVENLLYIDDSNDVAYVKVSNNSLDIESHKYFVYNFLKYN